MSLKETYYPESRFGGFSDLDGTIAFYNRVNSLLNRQSVVVDFGCGRGAYGSDPLPYRRGLRILRGKVERVIGLDVDPAGFENPFLDEFHRLESSRWPLENSSVDLIVCDQVLEHLPEPAQFFDEASRVVKTGGLLCLRTPNAWGYVGLISRIVPNASHHEVMHRLGLPKLEQDTFPTLYRCNTLPALRRALKQHRFEGAVYGYEAEPSYLAFNRLAYALGVLHQRFSPGFFRLAIFAFARSCK
jgi:SAM-dependent methyltransferase